jgi:hypothetical protein
MQFPSLEGTVVFLVLIQCWDGLLVTASRRPFQERIDHHNGNCGIDLAHIVGIAP